MAASLSGLSVSVTRILSLTGFPKESKTKDIQSALSDFSGQNPLRRVECFDIQLLIGTLGELYWLKYSVPDYFITYIYIEAPSELKKLFDNMDINPYRNFQLLALPPEAQHPKDK